jgi:glycosyltransferase involved in cell wall biosynthesis
MAEIVQHGVTGLHFEPGAATDLAAKVEWAWNRPEELARMGRDAAPNTKQNTSLQRTTNC